MDIVQFWSRMDMSGGRDACWEWRGSTGKNGYGNLNFRGRVVNAHRLAFQQVNGALAEGLFVLHRCDNRRCCNPRHLYAGTHAQNMCDMVERDRAYRGGGPPRPGTKNPMAKLNEAIVAELRARYEAGGVTIKELAKEVGIHHGTMGQCIRGETWRHVA
jgi:hypothetical protein